MKRKGSWWLSGLFLLCAGPVLAQGVDRELQEKINRAIDAGVAFLKNTQIREGNNGLPGLAGMWQFRNAQDQYNAGITALAAWALLESGVPPTDPVIQKAAARLRELCITEKQNYNVSLEIIFFDKLSDPNDVPLIESLGLRLMQGQEPTGGWHYDLNTSVPQEEQARLSSIVRNYRPDLPRPKLPRSFEQLDPAIQQQIQRMPLPAMPQDFTGGGDNSNTQFAMIALWVARRYGLPASPYLHRTATRFLHTQWQDGSWTYIPIVRGPYDLVAESKSPAMTCAGLLGLFVGIINDPKNENDPNLKKRLLEWQPVQAGFKYLDNVMRNMKSPHPLHYYFLWSMERVGMAYDVKLIWGPKGVDWYRWGAEWLVQNQSSDGSWQGGPTNQADRISNTAFALLFLKRANVFKDDPTLPPALLTVVPKEQPKAKSKEKAPPIDLSPLIIPKEEFKKKKLSGSKSSASRQSSWLLPQQATTCVLARLRKQPGLHERLAVFLALPNQARRAEHAWRA